MNKCIGMYELNYLVNIKENPLKLFAYWVIILHAHLSSADFFSK